MEKEINYYTFAENDYLFLKANIEENRIGNAMTSISQNVCERYLKHIITIYCIESDCTPILKTHSLKKILRFMEETIKDFRIDKKKVILADGYYFFPATLRTNHSLLAKKMWISAGKLCLRQKVRLTHI